MSMLQQTLLVQLPRWRPQENQPSMRTYQGHIYIFYLTMLEMLGSMNSLSMDFFADLGRKIGASSGGARKGRFLFQRLSMALQHYNIILLHESFVGVYD